ncbi:MAG: DNA polymerase III subunit delta [Phycisphaerae bacterium]|nr:DNA polymerase III subunit delta [Phycisphaerae bacterium]
MAKAARRTSDGAFEPDVSMRIVVLHGKELFLLWEHTRRITELLREAHGDVGVVRFDGAGASATAVLDELRTFGLLEPHKLVIVDDAERFLTGDAKRRAMEQYAASPAEQATLLLRAGTWRPGNLDKLIEPRGAIVRCDPVSEQKAIAWCIARARRRHDAELAQDAAELLVERIGSDLGRLDGEVGKLASACPTTPIRIDRELVSSMVGRSREEEAWLIQEVLLRADPAEALAKTRELISISRAEPVQLTWAIADLARKLHAAASMRAVGSSDGEISRRLRLWGGSMAILDAARRRPTSMLARLLHQAVDLDFRMKRGRAGDLPRSLEATAVEIAGGLAG